MRLHAANSVSHTIVLTCAADKQPPACVCRSPHKTGNYSNLKTALENVKV